MQLFSPSISFNPEEFLSLNIWATKKEILPAASMQVRITARAAEGQDWHFQQGHYMTLIYCIWWNWIIFLHFPFSKMDNGNNINIPFLWGTLEVLKVPQQKWYLRILVWEHHHNIHSHLSAGRPRAALANNPQWMLLWSMAQNITKAFNIASMPGIDN